MTQYYPTPNLTAAQLAAIQAALAGFQLQMGPSFGSFYVVLRPGQLANLPPEAQAVAAAAAAAAKATEERVRRRRMARSSIPEFPSSMLKSKALRTR